MLLEIFSFVKNDISATICNDGLFVLLYSICISITGTLLKVQEDGRVDRFCKLRAPTPRISRALH